MKYRGFNETPTKKGSAMEEIRWRCVSQPNEEAFVVFHSCGDVIVEYYDRDTGRLAYAEFITKITAETKIIF